MKIDECFGCFMALDCSIPRFCGTVHKLTPEQKKQVDTWFDKIKFIVVSKEQTSVDETKKEVK